MDTRLAAQLEQLANAILPLDPWIKSKPYVPPGAEKLPWRRSDAPPITPAQIGIVAFIEGLINESSSDEELRSYFSKRGEDPLELAPHDDVAAWRAARRMSPDPLFGLTESDNMLLDVEGHPISRRAFYDMYLPLFSHAVEAAERASSPLAWPDFADRLMTDGSPFWPRSLPRRSSTFMKQFGRDLLYAVLGMRNPAPEPYAQAVLIELGEHRRVGNAFTPADAERSLARFQAVFDPLLDEGKPMAEQLESTALAPVGAPPVTPRQQQY